MFYGERGILKTHETLHLLPRRKSAAMRTLPTELLDAVVDALIWDVEPEEAISWLRSVALVSRLWARLAQKHLFSSLLLDRPEDNPLALPRLVFLASRPHLGALVREIFIEDYLLPLSQLEPLIQYAFPNVQRVSLVAASIDKPAANAAAETLRQWTLAPALLRSLAKLRTLDILFMDPVALAADANLDGVSLGKVSITASSGVLLGRLVGIIAASQTMRLSLKTITLSMEPFDDVSIEEFQHASPTIVKELLSACNHLETVYIDAAMFAIGSHALRMCSDSVCRLELAVGADESAVDYLRYALCAADLPSLRTLSIRVFGRVQLETFRHSGSRSVIFNPFGVDGTGRGVAPVLSAALARQLSCLEFSLHNIRRMKCFIPFAILFSGAARVGVLQVDTNGAILEKGDEENTDEPYGGEEMTFSMEGYNDE